MVNNQPIKFIIDSGSPVTLIPKSKFNEITKIWPLKNNYKDVNNNEIVFEGKTNAKVKLKEKRMELPLLITRKETNPLLGLDWMEKLNIKIKEEQRLKYKK